MMTPTFVTLSTALVMPQPAAPGLRTAQACADRLGAVAPRTKAANFSVGGPAEIYLTQP